MPRSRGAFLCVRGTQVPGCGCFRMSNAEDRSSIGNSPPPQLASHLSIFVQIARASVDGFIEDEALTHGGAIAFYTATSIAPVLRIVVAKLAMIFVAVPRATNRHRAQELNARIILERSPKRPRCRSPSFLDYWTQIIGTSLSCCLSDSCPEGRPAPSQRRVLPSSTQRSPALP
jgi:hypothetical protein